MFTTVKFLSEKYGNYLDNYYTDNYNSFISSLQSKVKFQRQVNLGVADGVVIENNFDGDFQNINCAIVESSTYGTHLYKIIKRVFIKRNLWRITMIKDIISAKYNEIINSKVLVSRIGIDRSIFNPILFMPEPIEVSEVKKEQILLNELKDTKSYGYLAIWKRGSLNGNDEDNDGIVWKAKSDGLYNYDIKVNKLSDLNSYNDRLLTSYYRIFEDVIYMIDNNNHYIITDLLENSKYHFNYFIENSVDGYAMSMQYDEFNPILIEQKLKNYLSGVNKTLDTIGDIYKNLGKIVYEESSGNYYEIKIKTHVQQKVSYPLSEGDIKNIFGTDNINVVNPMNIEVRHYFSVQDYKLLNNTPTIEYVLSEYSNLIDQPFQMFYIPVIENGQVKYNNDLYTTNYIQIENMLFDLIAKYGGDNGKLVDVQVIPYSPIDGFERMWNNSILDIQNYCKDVITFGNDIIIPIFEVKYAQYSLSLEYVINVIDYKISQKDKYIITSPSGATPYEFSVSKNRGLEGFIINVDLRPYASYHQIQPIFKAIYGGNFKDTRGLIWKEDMSLTLVSSAWETYKRQNINYLNSFNAEQDYRRSELAITHEANWGNYGFDASKRLIEATVEASTYAADAVAKDVWFGAKGAVSGAAGAGVIMGGYVLGEALEAGQLAYNNKMDKKLLSNSVAHSREQFNYNIGNIKAIPENIEKVSGVYNTNNYVPYLQVFKPTEDEIIYLENYLDTYGVNVGMMVDLKNIEFDILQGTIIKYNGIITQEEYEEIIEQLAKGIRKVE